MKDQTIYLGLKVKNNKLTFKGNDIFTFNDDGNILTEYKINNTIGKLKRYLDRSMKMALKHSYANEVVTNGNITSLRLYIDVDGEKSKRKIDFLSFFDNEVTYI